MKVKKLLSLIFVAVIALGLASCDKCAKKPGPSTVAPTYTYRGYSSALGNNWNPHTWETNADQGILTYLSKGFVDLSIKDSKKGEYQWVYEMATDVKDVTASHQSDLTKYGSQLPEGKTLEECYEWAEEHKLNIHHWFFSTNLTSYRRGGRISSASFFLGQLLKICPLLNMDYLGRLIPRKKIRTKDKTIIETVNMMIEHAEDGTNYNGKCFICHSDCLDDAIKVKDLVESKFPNLKGKVRIYSVGTTIGSHTGPGTVALFFKGDKRED